MMELLRTLVRESRAVGFQVTFIFVFAAVFWAAVAGWMLGVIVNPFW